jgi:Ca2+-binding RTX toxin-like protein
MLKRGPGFLALAGLITAGALALPAGAAASTASVDAGTLNVSAGGGEINHISIEKVGTNFRIFDNTADLTTADADCTQVSDHFVRCSIAGVTLINVQARDQDDVVTVVGSTDARLDGGGGFDNLTSGSGDDDLFTGRTAVVGFGQDVLEAGDGSDTLHGPPNAGNTNSLLLGEGGGDTLLGGPGREDLNGGDGADQIQGGDGTQDTADYGTSAAAVTVTLDDTANDGAAGEGDNVHSDVEDIIGSSFDGDDLTGSAIANSISGASGNDTIRGGDGDDSLEGGFGNDNLDGGDGADFLEGGFEPTGADVFTGGPGIDLASFSDHNDPVTVTLNGVANDGASGEGDNVKTDVENIQGSVGNDTLTANNQENKLIGAGGGDNLKGMGGDDQLFGEFEFGGSGGNDTLDGGAEDDVLQGGTGADGLIGNAGFDTVDYTDKFAPLTISVNDAANDGEAGEGDNVRSTVESVLGGDGPDFISGRSARDVLFGGGGGDTLNGSGGDDVLDGEIPGDFSGTGADTFIGGGGKDTVSYASHFSSVTADNDGVADDGQSGGAEGDNVQTDVENLFGSPNGDILTTVGAVSNVVDGGPGFGGDILSAGDAADFLSGGFGGDTLNGEAGGDRLQSRGDNSVDNDNCGTESDTVEADSFDVLAGCETIFNSAPVGLAKAQGSRSDAAQRRWVAAKRLLKKAQRALDRINSG